MAGKATGNGKGVNINRQGHTASGSFGDDPNLKRRFGNGKPRDLRAK